MWIKKVNLYPCMYIMNATSYYDTIKCHPEVSFLSSTYTRSILICMIYKIILSLELQDCSLENNVLHCLEHIVLQTTTEGR